MFFGLAHDFRVCMHFADDRDLRVFVMCESWCERRRKEGGDGGNDRECALNRDQP